MKQKLERNKPSSSRIPSFTEWASGKFSRNGDEKDRASSFLAHLRGTCFAFLSHAVLVTCDSDLL